MYQRHHSFVRGGPLRGEVDTKFMQRHMAVRPRLFPVRISRSRVLQGDAQKRERERFLVYLQPPHMPSRLPDPRFLNIRRLAVVRGVQASAGRPHQRDADSVWAAKLDAAGCDLRAHALETDDFRDERQGLLKESTATILVYIYVSSPGISGSACCVAAAAGTSRRTDPGRSGTCVCCAVGSAAEATAGTNTHIRGRSSSTAAQSESRAHFAELASLRKSGSASTSDRPSRRKLEIPMEGLEIINSGELLKEITVGILVYRWW